MSLYTLTNVIQDWLHHEIAHGYQGSLAELHRDAKKDFRKQIDTLRGEIKRKAATTHRASPEYPTKKWARKVN